MLWEHCECNSWDEAKPKLNDQNIKLCQDFNCFSAFASFIKGARSYFSKLSFLFHLKDQHTKDINLKFELNRSSHLDAGSNFVYCSCLYLIV